MANHSRHADQIFSYLLPYEPVVGYNRRNSDLSAVLKTSKTLYAAALFTIYQNATFPHSPVYAKWLHQITTYPILGTLVRRMDFSQYSLVGIGRTGRMNQELQNLTASTLVKALKSSPNLREFLAQEALGPDVDSAVIEELFFNMPLLEALDFCGSSAGNLKAAFNEVMYEYNPKLPISFPVQRLSLHECTTLASSVFTALLPRLPNLTHLDLAHTQVTDSALMSIPHSAKITHLSLSKCARLKGENVVTFLLDHPAVQNLQVLNLGYDSSRYRLLSSTDLEDLLPQLPKSLVSLNLTGAATSSEHMPLIMPLVSRLEELSLGHSSLTMDDINALFVPQWKSSLKYLDISGITSVTPNALLYSSNALLQHLSAPLEVLEMSEKIVTGCLKRDTLQRFGWAEQSYGRRSCVLRTPSEGEIKDCKTTDNGSRSWKMGSKKWGNRKIPCNWGEVGGTYAYYGLGK